MDIQKHHSFDHTGVRHMVNIWDFSGLETDVSVGFFQRKQYHKGINTDAYKTWLFMFEFFLQSVSLFSGEQRAKLLSYYVCLGKIISMIPQSNRWSKGTFLSTVLLKVQWSREVSPGRREEGTLARSLTSSKVQTPPAPPPPPLPPNPLSPGLRALWLDFSIVKWGLSACWKPLTGLWKEQISWWVGRCTVNVKHCPGGWGLSWSLTMSERSAYEKLVSEGGLSKGVNEPCLIRNNNCSYVFSAYYLPCHRVTFTAILEDSHVSFLQTRKLRLRDNY